MVLHDREVRMAFPVGAMQDISALCPDGDIRRMMELFDISNKPMDFAVVIKMVAILSYWGEEQYAFFHPGHEPRPFTEKELKLLSVAEVQQLFVDAVSTINGDSKREIETEPVGKKE